MRKLLKYLKNYRKESALAPLLKLCEATLELFVPLFIASMIDGGIVGGDRSAVIRTAAILAAIYAAGLAFSVTAQYFAAKAATGFAADVRSAVFKKIQRLSCSALDGAGVSSLITRLTGDADQVQTAVNLTLRLLLRSPFIVFGAAVMAFTVDVRAAVVFAVAIPVLAIAVFAVMLACIPLYKKVRAALDGILRLTRENLSGVRVIRAFRRENQEIAEFDSANEKLTVLQKLTGRVSAILNPAAFLIVNLAVIWLLHKGALRVESGALSQGAVVALYNYMSQILVELIKLADLIINLTKGVACGNRIEAVLELPEEERAPVSEAAPHGAHALEFQNVSFRYEGAGDCSLKNVSFTADKGETVGVIGGTGSGKSTLAALIRGFYPATEGGVFVGGRDINALPEDELTRRISAVPQKAVLFSGTVAENLRWRKPEATEAELREALSTACALDFIDAREDGTEARVERGGKNFSGGQRQRLTIARALVGSPEILVLDDSSSALDLATEAELRRNLAQSAAERVTVVISQRTSSIAHADRIIVLDEGRQVGSGRHEELLANCAVYREIYESQYKKEASV